MKDIFRDAGMDVDGTALMALIGRCKDENTLWLALTKNKVLAHTAMKVLLKAYGSSQFKSVAPLRRIETATERRARLMPEVLRVAFSLSTGVDIAHLPVGDIGKAIERERDESEQCEIRISVLRDVQAFCGKKVNGRVLVGTVVPHDALLKIIRKHRPELRKAA